MNDYLSFDSVWLKPQYSDIDSRSEVSLQTNIGGLALNLPFISANMDTITEFEMAKRMAELGGAGILHRFSDREQIQKWVKELSERSFGPRIISIGIDDSQDLEFIATNDYRLNAVCIDVAHIDTKKGLRRIEEVRKLIDKQHHSIVLIAGNIATKEAAKRVVDAGARVVKTSIAGGSVCTTRLATGHMVPTLGATIEIADCLQGRAHIIADGGIRNAADVAKCLAAGANAVMLGSILAGSTETPGEITQGDDGTFYKTYRGSASKESQLARNPHKKPRVEGVSKQIPLKGDVSLIIDNLSDGLRSAFSYSGARNLAEFQQRAEFILVR